MTEEEIFEYNRRTLAKHWITFRKEVKIRMNEQNTPITPERIRDELGQHVIDCMYDGDESKEIRELIETYLLVNEVCN